ncbi:MAG: hypothetical protein GY835_27755 [bacterium]|nr:hypothetical protein [bacterium]
MTLLETPAECLIRVDNREIKFNISSVRLDQFIDSHHQLALKIQQVGTRGAENDFEDPGDYARFLGSNITLNIKPRGGVVAESRALEFIGVITDVQLENSIDGLNMVRIHAASPTIAMDGAVKNAHYHEKSASDIVSGLVGNYPITVGTIESTGGKYKFASQYRESDFDYVMRLATGSGMFAWYSGRDFNMAPATGGNTVDLKWREDLGALKVGLGTAPTEFKSDVYNYEQKKIYKQDSQSIAQEAVLSDISKNSPDASKRIFGVSGFSAAPKVVEDAQSLDKVLKNERRKAMGGMIRCNGQSIVPEVAVGSCVQVNGMDKLDGQYWVIGVRHLFDESGKYHNTFICTPLDIAYPGRVVAKREFGADGTQSDSAQSGDANSIETVLATKKAKPGMHVARVVDLDDPEALGRIKVSYPWLDSEQTAWVRMMVPHAGADRGWYMLPELEDEVLIGYEHGDTNYPVVLGCLYNKENAPLQEAVSSDNNIKMFQTRSGNKIVFNDEEGAEQITISQKDGENQIVLDMSGPSISITSKGDISLKGVNLNVDMDGGITLKAAGDVSIEGVNIKNKADANITSEASANHDIKGNAQVNVQGGIINLN